VYVRRHAGPPAPLIDTFAWTLVSVAAYCCFLWLPRRLTRALDQAASSSPHNDVANAGGHMHIALWTWPLLDLLYRGLAVVLLAPQHAAIFAPALFDAAAVMESGALQAAAALRTLAVDTASDAQYLADSPKRLSTPGYWTHREVVAAAVALAFAGWLWLTWLLHARHALRLRAVVHKMDRDGVVPARVSLFPVVAWVALWSLCFGCAFMFVKGMPILMGTCYPAAVVGLIIYCVVIP
jgi:hypothetical protein